MVMIMPGFLLAKRIWERGEAYWGKALPSIEADSLLVNGGCRTRGRQRMVDQFHQARAFGLSQSPSHAGFALSPFPGCRERHLENHDAGNDFR
jgi:hypothetical protein